MRLYTEIFGRNASADDIMESIGITEAGTGRFRDAYAFEEYGIPCYGILTRNGGDQTQHFHGQISCMMALPTYRRYFEWTPDKTYMVFVFGVAPNDIEKWRIAMKVTGKETPLDRLKDSMENPNAEKFRPAMERFAKKMLPVVEHMAKSNRKFHMLTDDDYVM